MSIRRAPLMAMPGFVSTEIQKLVEMPGKTLTLNGEETNSRNNSAPTLLTAFLMATSHPLERVIVLLLMETVQKSWMVSSQSSGSVVLEWILTPAVVRITDIWKKSTQVEQLYSMLRGTQRAPNLFPPKTHLSPQTSDWSRPAGLTTTRSQGIHKKCFIRAQQGVHKWSGFIFYRGLTAEQVSPAGTKEN